jgi:hypothetical protein
MIIVVKKANAELTISENELEKYLANGYTQIDAKTGKKLKEPTGGGTVSVAEHNRLKAELEKLKGKNKGK